LKYCDPVRPVEWNTIPNSTYLVLLTMERVEDNISASMADFRDDFGLFHPGLGKWVGLSRDRGIRFGVGTPELRDGIWYVQEDEASAVQDVQVSASDLILRPI